MLNLDNNLNYILNKLNHNFINNNLIFNVFYIFWLKHHNDNYFKNHKKHINSYNKIDNLPNNLIQNLQITNIIILTL